MYGLTGSKAALLIAASALVAPVGVWAGSHAQLSSSQVSSSSSASSSTYSYGVYVTLNIDEGRDLVLRLDLSDTDAVCSPSVPTLYGQSLPSDEDGNGSGELRLKDGSLMLARWSRECVQERKEGATTELAQRIELTVEGLGGELVPEASFVLILEPTEDSGSQVSYSLHLESEHFSARPRTFASTSAFFSQKADSKHTGDHHGGISAQDEQTVATSLWNCSEFRCVFKDIANRIQKIKDDINEWRRPHGGSNGDSLPSPTTTSTEDGKADDDFHTMEQPSEQQQQRVKPVKSFGASKTSPTPSTRSSQTPFAMPSLPPPDKDLVMTLVLAAIAFTVFSLSSICLIRMRYTPDIQRRPRRHHETHEERLARDESRRQAVRGFFRGMFCGLLDLHEKDESPEAATSSSSPQGRDLRAEEDARPETPPTTMEQELAGFREAASMVSNLIAAEEGRHSRMMQQRRTQPDDITPRMPPVPPPRPSLVDPARAMYTGYNNDSSSSLPTYEFANVETSMISDGFRYSPGQFQYAPSSPTETGSQGTSSSDRLGYGNKD